ncbi:HEAT repeat domain-containing protein [Streptomyces sp. NBC_01320]|uniref:HEAT repeat domain-containing protein n=1 Tax=Streptomyces sp. NBC_01320 TaxID=2903824 RepID=UPI002E0ECE1D|nr:hypothetical protein OG395_43230 [Streptomyces sp. NBC_01320]
MGVDVVRDLGLPDRRDAAAAALVALGSDALPPLVGEPMDEASQVVRREITAVLGRIGGAGFEAVLRGLLDAPTEESRHRVGFAFSRYGAAALGRYVDAPSHPSPLVCLQAVRGIRQCDEAGLPAVPALLPLLGDPVREVAQQAQDTWSSEAGAWCRCCSASAGKVRAGSGRGVDRPCRTRGETALSPADRAAVERLIHVKLLPALPESGDHARCHGVSYISGPDGSIGVGKGERACRPHGRHARPLRSRTVPPLTGSVGDGRVRNPRNEECLP